MISGTTFRFTVQDYDNKNLRAYEAAHSCCAKKYKFVGVLTFVVIVPSWFLSNTVKASWNVANSSAVRDSRIFLRSASLKVVMFVLFDFLLLICLWLPIGWIIRAWWILQNPENKYFNLLITVNFYHQVITKKIHSFTNAQSFYRSQNVLDWSKFFVPDQNFIYILWQSQTFCARQKDDLHSVKLVFVPAQKFLKRH